MHATPRILATALVVLLLASMGGCQKRTPKDRPLALIPQEVTVGVAWFTQPITTSELITGQLPAHQGKIASGLLADLDAALARVFAQESGHQPVILPAPTSMPSMSLHESGSPQALRSWLEIGRKADVDLLFVPLIIHWRERDGGEAGAAKGAAVKAEFYLLDIARERLLKQLVFEEEQIGLVDNLLTVGKFFKRKGRWVSATELTQEGMSAAIREFGL